MYPAALLFLGLSGLAVAILVGISIGRRALACFEKATCADVPTWDDNATWDAIRLAWTESYASCRAVETQAQKALLSWGRTLALCTALCFVGILLEVEFGCPISIDHIVAGLVPSHSTITFSHPSQSQLQ